MLNKAGLIAAPFAATMLLSGIVVAQVCSPPPPNMIRWYPGDTDAGDLVGPDAGTLLNGAIAGAPGLVDGSFGLDGVDDAVAFTPPPYVEGNSYSYDFWFRAQTACDTSINDHGTILRVGKELLVWRDRSRCDNLFVGFSKTGTGEPNPGIHLFDASLLSFQPGEWNHFAATFDGSGTGTLSVYINGSLVAATSTPTAGANWQQCVRQGPRAMTVGRSCSNSGGFHQFYGGQVDEIEIFDRLLSASEVQAIYAAGAAGKCKLDELTLTATADSFLRRDRKNFNEGANPRLRFRKTGHNRIVVGFDAVAIADFTNSHGITKATLTLTIAENRDNWRYGGHPVQARPLNVDFTEGNGQSGRVPSARKPRGNGPGVTWNCATDADIANRKADCAPRWNGGTFGPMTADPVLHTNGLTGPVSWDVTADVMAGATSWLIKKSRNGKRGQVHYYSKEGADKEGDIGLAPTLRLE